MTPTCSLPDCTFEQTGICILNHDPNTCPQRQGLTQTSLLTAGLPPVLPPPTDEGVRLVPSLTMGSDDVQSYLRRRLCTQVGVLGFPNAGKTAALVSIYLLVSNNQMEGFQFRDCRTLMAFEQISRGAREWRKDALPEQVTAHTESADGRTAGFLHFKLFDQARSRDVEFFIPDLPGEWTSTLVDQNRSDRLEFLRAADVIWLFVDGRQLATAKARQEAVHRTQLVIRRAADFLGAGVRPPLALVVTRRDDGQPHQASIDAILGTSSDEGFDARVIEIASFSMHPDVAPAGAGLVELVKTLRPKVRIAPEVLVDERRAGARFAMNFRNS